MSRVPGGAALLFLSALWGASYIFIDIALRDFDPSVVACARQMIGAACLAPVALNSRYTLEVSRRQLPWLVLIAATMVGGPALLISAGQQHVSASLAAVLVATSPMATALLALSLDREERLTRVQAAGIVIGLMGIALLFGLDLGDSTGSLAGGGALLLASLGYAVGGFLVKHKAATIPPLGLMVIGSAISAVLLLPGALTSLPRETPSALPVFALFELGIVGTAAGWYLYYHVVQAHGLQRATLVQYLAPAFSVLLGVSLLGDELSASSLAGLILILAGTWLAARRPAPSR